MGKIKTIYSIKGIFTKLLEDGNKKHFLVPAYQRGYKWNSIAENSQVKVLMKDLFKAYKESAERYYLQFITLKDSEDYFEVVDGQQRLTTLTILYCLLFCNKKLNIKENFVKEKLIYKIRKNFISEFIYNDINKILSYDEWDAFLEAYPSHNNQDVFYIFHATKSINEFISKISSEDELSGFFNYISDSVQIITNLLDKEMNSEKVFVNVNKGVILKDEDLVKGLLITKIPLDSKKEQYRLTENEINEIRATLGRQWDEISHWANKKEITAFYKQPENGNIEWLIRLAFPDVIDLDSDYPFFNYLSVKYKDGEKAKSIFNRIHEVKQILDDWYNIPEIHNLLGFIIHSKNSNNFFSVWDELKELKTKKEITHMLKEVIKNKIPYSEDESKLFELNYRDSKNELFNLFFIMDVMKHLPINYNNNGFYDFGLIDNEKWSIEHIFPQNIDDLKRLTFFSNEDLIILKELLPETFSEEDIDIEDATERKSIIDLYNKIKKPEEQCPIEDSERPALQYLLANNANVLHKLGNLALLETGINSSLSNNFFDEKRKIIVKKVSMGKFVPFHTYDVFSKLIIGENTSLHVWTNSDIRDHEEYIQTKISELYIYLNSKKII